MNNTPICRLTLLIAIFLTISFKSFTQSADQPKANPGQVYYFIYDIKLETCDPDGSNKKDPEFIFQGTYFTVTSVVPGSGYVITINLFKYKDKASAEVKATQLQNRKTYNFKSMDGQGSAFTADGKDNIKRFYLSQQNFALFASEKKDNFPIDFGTLLEPFKFRSNPSLFTSNLSLGAIIGFQKNFRNSNYNWGVYAGISLSSVTLDSFSTKGTVTTNTERPAFTPSVNLLLGYKSINVTFGVGWDIINQTSYIEQSWVYQGKPWIGLGIGIKLFSTNNTSAPPSDNQEKKPPK